MKRGVQLYEGKAKIIYATENKDLVIQYFKDDASAFDGKKKGTIVNKGVMNNKITTRIFELLEEKGINTHLVKSLNEREMVVKKLEIFPIEVIVRNVVAGSLSKRMGLEEGTPLKKTVLEFYYKNDDLGDPMINEYHIETFDLAGSEEVAILKERALRVNDVLVPFFDDMGIRLVDFKLEFGRHKGEILLGDEITPDSCRLWDKETNEKLDKDRFRRDLGKVEEAYERIYEMVCKG